MSSVRPLHKQSAPQWQEAQASDLIRQVLSDAVQGGLLFPSSVKLLSFSQHQDGNQRQFSVQTEAGAFFIKCQGREYATHFEAEQACLLKMMATQTIAVCAPLASGVIADADLSYIVLQHIPLAVHGDWFSAGQQLAQMHNHTSEQGYGFDMTTYCGETPQDNRWNDNWADFYLTQRLEPMFNRLQQTGVRIRGMSRALSKASDMLSGHQPAPCLLHGDLWSGNIGFNPDRQISYPVLYDPSSFYGDIETDLAMTELFGRFPQKFYQGYQSLTELDAGYERRRPLYQLYHLLNHAFLFGGAYIEQSESQIRDLD